MPNSRLNKYLAQCGVAARRRADEIIASGRVCVNGNVVRELGTVVAQAIWSRLMVLSFGRRPSTRISSCTSPSGLLRRCTIRKGAGPLRTYCRGRRVVPVGRLDYATSGALLLSDDGELANRLLHPRFGVEKMYRVTIAGHLSPDNVRQLESRHRPRRISCGRRESSRGGRAARSQRCGHYDSRGPQSAGPPNVRSARPSGARARPDAIRAAAARGASAGRGPAAYARASAPRSSGIAGSLTNSLVPSRTQKLQRITRGIS